MKCRKCGEPAVLELRRHNAAFCAPDFLEFFRNQVREAIRKHRMLTKDEMVLVAVSGGKDSLALWDVLIDEGYRTTGLYLDLGIFEYSVESKAKCEKFAAARGVPLIVSAVSDAVGAPVPVIKDVTRRPPCSGCGLSKRYLMNRVALEHEMPVVATGHNLDDEAATLFGSVMHWQTDALPRQSPALPSTHPKLVRRVKPLYRLSERETAAFAFLRKIDYIVEECPFAAGATSIAHKEILSRMEDASPGAKHNFLLGCVDQIGEQGFNIARNAALIAGFPVDVCGTTLDRMCGSGQQAANFAAMGVMSGQYDVVIAGGIEHMTRVPMGSNAMGPGDGPPSPKLQERFNIVPQGISAEMIAEKWGLTREALDEFSARSHEKAGRAISEGRFKREIAAVALPDGSVFDTDEGVRVPVNREKMAALAPSFKPDGVVTAASSSQISDGAAALMFMSPERAKSLGLRPRARGVATALAGG